MKPAAVRASSDWLALREPADAAARATELVAALRSSLPSTGVMNVFDLGCGTGSMARWLAAQLRGSQHWVLCDRDAELLALVAVDPALEAADGSLVTLETRRRDITWLDKSELVGASLVTASALLDMMTAQELERLVAICARTACPVLIALSVTGCVDLMPTDPFDQDVTDAFNAHQRRTLGKRRLLGPDAVGAAVDSFTRLDVEVLVRPSPWRLGPDQAALLVRWFVGWLAAACEQRPALGAEAASYARRRLAEAAAGQLSVTVHHQDLLARPRGTTGHG